MPAPRGFKTAEPEDVANAIVEALQTGRFEVYVPKSLGPTVRLKALLPTAVVDAVARFSSGDQVLAIGRSRRARRLRDSAWRGPRRASAVEVTVEVPAVEREPETV